MSASLLLRRHPEYNSCSIEWEFFLKSYKGGKSFIDDNLHQYYKEGDTEYKQRKERAYRENHTKRVVDLLNSYQFKESPKRSVDNKILQNWLQNIDGKDTELSKFIKSVSMYADILGRVYVAVDKKQLPKDEETGTQLDTLKSMPYCYLIFPQNVLDLAFNDDGTIRWILIREDTRDDADPFNMTGDVTDQYRLWIGGEWYLFDSNGSEIEKGDTGLGRVPIIVFDNEETDNAYYSRSFIADIAYLDRAIFNNWSRLDVILNDQTFSQLIMPVESLVLVDTDTDDSNDKKRQQLIKIATNRILLYSSEAGTTPQYISPDANQAKLILDTIKQQTEMLYAVIGAGGEIGTQATEQSGVAKSYDFDKLNKLLVSKGKNLEQLEYYIIKLFGEWMNISLGNYQIQYPDTYDVKSLSDELLQVQSLLILGISQTFDKEILKGVVAKAIPQATPEILEKINKEIERRQTEPQNGESTFPFDEAKHNSQNTEE